MGKNTVVEKDDTAASFEDGQVEQEQEAPQAEATAPEVDHAAENARLKAENEALRTVKVEVNQAPQVVQQPQLTREDLARKAVELGFTKTDDNGNTIGDVEKLEAVSKIATAANFPTFQKVTQLEQQLHLERALNKAKKEAASQDSQFHKLESHVDEYLDNVSTEDKLNPEKLKKHMEIAKTYAKGKVGFAPAPQRKVQAQTQVNEDESNTEGKVWDKPEVHTTKDGKIRMVSRPLVNQKVRDMHSHPDVEGGVQIDPREEWSKKPKFGNDR